MNRVLLERMGHPADAVEALAVHQREGGEPPAAFAPHFAEWTAHRA